MSFVPSRRLFVRRATVLSSLAGLIVLFAATPAATQPTFMQICFGTNLSHGIAVADFDNDGDQDVALNPGQPAGPGFSFSNEIHIFLGNGDGTFVFAGQDSAAGTYLDLFAVDVDNDGDQDLVAGGNPASVLRGNGDGTFQAAETYATTNLQFCAAIGDLNGDGFTDLITPDDTRSIVVRLNQGDGTFGAEVDRVRVHEIVRTMTTTDLNGDGDLDVVAILEGPFRLRVLLGKGDGTLRNPIKTDLDSGAPGRDVAPADFNGDGMMDLGVAAYNGGGLVFLPGNGNGKFGSPTSYPMAGNTTRLDVGDFDGDGNDDIVAGNFNANFPTNGNVSILYGNGAGSFTIGTVIPVAFGNGVVAADLNADSNLDLVVDWCALLSDGTVASAAAAPVLSQPTVTAAPASLTAGVSPNPIQRQGALGFSLPRGGKVSIHLYDVRGRRVHTLMDRTWLAAGNHNVGLDRRRAGLDAGMYFYRIEAEGTRKSGSIVVLDH